MACTPGIRRMAAAAHGSKSTFFTGSWFFTATVKIADQVKMSSSCGWLRALKAHVGGAQVVDRGDDDAQADDGGVLIQPETGCSLLGRVDVVAEVAQAVTELLDVRREVARSIRERRSIAAGASQGAWGVACCTPPRRPVYALGVLSAKVEAQRLEDAAGQDNCSQVRLFAGLLSYRLASGGEVDEGAWATAAEVRSSSTACRRPRDASA